MRFSFRPQNALFMLLVAALHGPLSAGAMAVPVAKKAVSLTAFDEGKADGRAYRLSVQRTSNNGSELITQQVQAAQSAAVANPSAAPYFQGYVAGLEPNSEVTTLLNARR